MNAVRKLSAATLACAALACSPSHLHAQASAIPSAQTAAQSGDQASADQDRHGRALLNQMVEALGGDAWLNRRTAVFHGNTAAFFRGQPNLGSPPFWDFRQFGTDADHILTDRIEFTKKRDVVQIWTAGNGYEITYKGNKPLPADQVKDYYLRQAHSLEAIVRVWLKQPDTVVLYEGASSVERRQAEKVTLLSANNDAVTVELDATSHLPLRRTFESRNAQFKDHDEDVEQYDDYHSIQGVMTPLTISRYKNGDLANQRFYLDVKYNEPIAPDMFDTDLALKHKK